MRINVYNREDPTFFTGVNNEFIEYMTNNINITNEEILNRLSSKLQKENIEPSDRIIEIVKDIITAEYSDDNNEIHNFIINGMNETSKLIEFIPNYLLCIKPMKLFV